MEKQPKGRARLKVEGIGEREPDQHAGVTGVCQLHDPLSGLHRPAEPVVRIAKDGNAVPFRAYFNASQQVGDRGQLRLLLLDPTLGGGHLGLAAGVVKSLLLGDQGIGLGDGEGLQSDLAPIGEGRLVQGEQGLARLDRRVGLDVEGFDHAILRRRDSLGMQRDHFGRCEG